MLVKVKSITDPSIKAFYESFLDFSQFTDDREINYSDFEDVLLA